MTRLERIDAVERLGYTRREAVFITLAALHSGYFLRRQYSSVLTSGHGPVEVKLIRKLIGHGHARHVVLSARNQLFHLHDKRLYAAMSEEDHPNRRPKAPWTIKLKLVALDYILAHRDYEFLAGERERLEYFRSRPKTDAAVFPRAFRHLPDGSVTARYFAEDFPIGVNPCPENGAPSVLFCCVVIGTEPLVVLERFVRRYRSLAELTDGARFVLIGENDRIFDRARAAFDRIWSRYGLHGTPDESGAPEIAALVRYFQIRARYERGAFEALTTEDLHELRAGRDRFGAPQFDAQFGRWLEEGGEPIVPVPQAASRAEADGSPARAVSLLTWHPKGCFNLFGSLWGSRA